MTRQARDFATPEALRKYLHDHPGADPHKHRVEKPEGGHGSGAARVKTKVHSDVAREIEKVWKNKPSSNAVDVVKRMIDDDKDISVNLLGRAVRLLNNEMQNAKGDEKKGLKAIRDKLKGEMHKEANARIASSISHRFAALLVGE